MPGEIEIKNISSREMLGLIFREKWLIVGLVLGCLAGTLLLNAFVQKEYEASARLLVKVGHEKALASLTSQEETYLSPMLRPEDIATEIEIIKSPNLLRRLVLQNGVQRYLPQSRLGRWLESCGVKDWLRRVLPGKPREVEKEIQSAVEAIEKKLKVDQVVNTDIISIRYAALTPQEAADTVNQLVDLYLEKHIELNTSKGISELLDRQAELSKQELGRLQGRMQKYMIETPVGATGSFSQATSSPSIGYLETKLIELELEAKRLSGIYEPGSQPVQDIRRQLTETRVMLHGEKSKYAEMEKRIQELGQERTIVEQKNQLYERKLDASRLFEALGRNKIVSVNVIDRALPPAKPKGLNFIFRLGIALGVSLLLCIVALGSMFYLDDTVHEEERIVARLQLPVAGSIPWVKPSRLRRSPAEGHEGPLQLAWRAIINDFTVRTASTRVRTILLTSFVRGEGTTTLAHHFADMLAFQSGSKVLLLDGTAIARLRAQSMVGGEAPELSLTPIRTEGRMDVTAVRIKGALGYAAAAERLQELMQQLAKRYTYVVVETAPVLQAPDSVLWLPLAQALFFVLEAGRTRIPVITKTLEVLRKHPLPLLGVILNKRRYPIPDAIYKVIYP